MSEKENSGGWSHVPEWDGSPQTWRSFMREMEWWMCSLDLEATKKYNLAARWLLRQSGIVRQRGEEFLPSELAFQPEIKGVDPVTEQEVILVECDPLSGLRKLLKALEQINGSTILDKRGDLRNQFYLDLKRRQGERISEFCTRFRCLVGELRREGVSLPTSELGWFLKQKMGLDGLRMQLLETALQGKESYEETEAEALRLFKDLHSADPLRRQTLSDGGGKVSLMNRFLSQQPRPQNRSTYAPSSAPSSSSYGTGRSGSTFASQRFGSSPGQNRKFSGARQAYAAEVEEHDEPEVEQPEEPADEGYNLEEVLQAEAEILATELEEALDEGVAPDLLQDVEDRVESAAEALLTMREARTKLAEVKKDRGFGKASADGGGKSSGKGNAKKSSGKHPCFDCCQHGHWAGDPECPKPGAGLGRKGAKKPVKSVKVVEALNTEHQLDDVTLPSGTNEVLTVSNVPRAFSLSSALNAHLPVQEVQSVSSGLSADKLLVGALDSACNRTVTGPEWLHSFLQGLESAPKEYRDLVTCKKEFETFRFGDGGTQVSTDRWRLPTIIGGTLVCFWTSVVPVPSLGLLLGRDFLESVGAILSFSRKAIKFEHLNSTAIPLKQLAAGHYLLRLLPSQWSGLGPQRWRKLGIDGVIELQLSSTEWLSRKLAATRPSRCEDHEHFLTETSLKASLAVHRFVDEDVKPGSFLVQDSQETCMTTCEPLVSPTTSSTRSSTLRSRTTRCLQECLSSVHESSSRAQRSSRKMAPLCRKALRPSSLACFWIAAMACSTAWSALCSTSVPSYWELAPLAASGSANGGSRSFAPWNSGQSRDAWKLHHGQHAGCDLAEESNGLDSCVHGRSAAGWNFGWSFGKGSSSQGEAGEHCGGQGSSCQGPEGWHDGRSSPGSDWSSRRHAGASTGFGEVGGFVESSAGREDDRSPDQGGHQAYVGRSQVQCPKQGYIDGSFKLSATSGEGNRARCFEVLSTEGYQGCLHPRSDAKSTEAVRDYDGSSRSSFGEHRRKNSRSSSSGLLARAGRSRYQHDGGGHRRADSQEIETIGGGCSRVHGRCLQTATGGPIWSPGDGGFDPRGRGSSAGSVNSPWTLHQKLKRGQAQMISQAWEKHVRDRLNVSVGHREVRQALVTEYEQEMQSFINDEIFVHCVDLTTSLRSTSGSSRGMSSLRSPCVSEVYTNTQRVMSEAARRGHRVGTPMSLENGWDFLRADHRRMAKELVKREKPFFLVLAFPCGPFSPLQRLRFGGPDPEIVKNGRILMEFALELAELQIAGGRHYLLENPKPSAAWKEPRMIRFIEEQDPWLVDFDQCRFGLKSVGGNLHKKATRVASSSPSVTSLLDGRVCTRAHVHDPVIGGSKVTVRAGHYPAQLARAMVRGMEQQFDGEVKKSSEVFAVSGGGDDTDDGSSTVPSFYSDSEDEFPQGAEDDAKIPASIRAAVARLHENTGHRSTRRLARALTIAGAPSTVVRAAKQHKCSICMERAPPKSQRPASLPHPRDVSDQVHIDLVEVADVDGESYYVVHATDFCTRFQMAQVIERKTAGAVVKFLKTRWFPIFGPMRVLVADQGREFISWELQEFCSEHSVLLWHIGVGAPWQNGIAERSGGILKAILAATVMANSVQGAPEMELALGEALSAYNMDVNDSGVSPCQAALGRQPRLPGDTLSDIPGRLAEHGLADSKPTFMRQLALRETAKLAMTRLHFSRGLRRASLARSRDSTITSIPTPGSIVYFFRFQKYNNKNDGKRGRLSLRRWHGPGLLVAVEQGSEGSPGANAYISYKGQLTNCSLEHVREASPMEQIAADVWHDAIEEAVSEAMKDITKSGLPVSRDRPESVPDGSATAAPRPVIAGSEPVRDLPPVQPEEVLGALQAPVESEPPVPTSVGSLVGRQTTPMTRQSTPLTVPEAAVSRSASSTGVPGHGHGSRSAFPVLEQQVLRARAIKRAAEVGAEQLKERTETDAESVVPSAPIQSSEMKDALVVDKADVLSVLADDDEKVHPLMRIHRQACYDRANSLEAHVRDHGTWHGRWNLPSRSEWAVRQRLGLMWPCGTDDLNEVSVVQAARKEYHWSAMNGEQKAAFQKAAETGWSVRTTNDAVEVLSDEESLKVREELRARKEESKILTPRWVFTDKHDGLRTPENNLELKASARLVVPGFKDVLAFSIRKDAPTASRLSQHLLLTFTASYFGSLGWRLLSCDVKAAFMKGNPYMAGTRELFIENVRNRHGEPQLPFGPKGLARVRKGVFGLSDAPRQWYLRLHRALTELGWTRNPMDAACWMLWNEKHDKLLGLCLSHVDDLLVGGNEEARASILSLEKALGFGSVEHGSFNYCGKRITQQDDGVITVTMREYHENIKPVEVPARRRAHPESELSPSEHKQLRGILGSLQWLVAQTRIDQGFALSSIQGESRPTIGTLLRANLLVKKFKQSGDFGLTFRPMNLDGAGVMVVTDSSLGNVCKDGSVNGSMKDKVYSQSSYVVLLGDAALMRGEEGTFNLLDARSHRLSRVCRSTYAAELLGTEEAFDAGQYCRGVLACMSGYPVETKYVDTVMNVIPLTVVVDAKDVFDKASSDTPSYGSQKSLAFTVAWVRSVLRKPNTSLRWTSTENLFVDGGTKDMDLSHMRQILSRGRWSAKYNTDFIKSKSKPLKDKAVVSTSEKLPGQTMSESHPVFPYLHKLSEQPGWHFQDQIAVQIARNAKSFRSPVPRLNPKEYPVRSTYGRFDHASGHAEWRILEEQVRYSELSTALGMIGSTAAVLCSIYMPQSTKYKDPLLKLQLDCA